jgi:hypothetical protein
MRECGEHYWGYGFERHKGYGTEQHRAALTTAGPLPIHRCSFAPVAALADKQLPFALGGMVARTRHALKSARADGGRRGQIWALFAH